MKDETLQTIVNAAFAGVKEAVFSVFTQKGLKCEIKDCKMLSVGARCSCGKLLCNHHLYFKLNPRTIKPEAICPSCVVDAHAELFEL